MMNRKLMVLIFIIGLLFYRVQTEAAEYVTDPAHSQIGFQIRHLVSRVSGRFDVFTATITYDEKNPSGFKADATINTASVNTSIEKRDAHLKSPDFFNAEKYPAISFKSTSVKVAGKNKLVVKGNFTLLGVTKPITLEADFLGIAKDPWGSTRAGFSAVGKINRKDFGMVYNMAMDQGGFLLGDEVDLLIEVEAVEKKP